MKHTPYRYSTLSELLINIVPYYSFCFIRRVMGKLKFLEVNPYYGEPRAFLSVYSLQRRTDRATHDVHSDVLLTLVIRWALTIGGGIEL